MAYTYDGQQVDNHKQEAFWDWWKNNRSIGGGSDKFGAKDYFWVLKHQAANSSWLGSIRDARQTAYDFLTLNPDYVHPTNREGYTDSDKQNVGEIGHNLMELMSGQGSARFIGAHVGLEAGDRMNFLYEDFMHARSIGFSDRQILEFLDGPGRAYKDRMFADHGSAMDAPGNIYNHIWSVNNHNSYPYGGYETDQPIGDPTEPGDRDDVGLGSMYGGADYIKTLKDDWDLNKSTANLDTIRTDALRYLENALEGEVHDRNRPLAVGGHATGLHNMILNSNRPPDSPHIRGRSGRLHLGDFARITETFGGHEAWTDEDSSQWGEGDYLAAKAGGWTEYDIYRHLHGNESLRSSGEGQRIYNDVRNGLITRGQDPARGDDYHNYHYFLENPLWYELGVHLSSRAGTSGIPSAWHDYDWYTFGDFRRLQGYINENFTSEMAGGGQGMVTGYATDEHLQILTGIDPGVGSDGIGWQVGQYWQQYGASGPPDRDQGDGASRSDLKWVEKMVAQAGLWTDEPSTARTQLEDFENRFISEVYGPGDLYLEAEDHWGLDIVREVGDYGSGDRLSWAGIGDMDIDDISDERWETLTRGRVNWSYYQNDDDYKNAVVQLGFDENKAAADRKIDTVREIRLANIYIHGMHQASTSVDIGDWDEYEDRRRLIKRTDGTFVDGQGNLVVPPEPEELDIVGYDGTEYWQNTLQKPNTPETYHIEQPRSIQVPTINNPDVTIRRPEGIPGDWDIRSGTPEPSTQT